MNTTEDPLKQIAQRIRGLREVLDISPQEMADTCHIPLEQYEQMEEGKTDFTVSILQTIAHRYGIELDVLMFGQEPRMGSYFLTRAGTGVSVERRAAYKYQSLASGFRGRRADAFIVTVEPKAGDEPLQLNAHEGQEFNHVLEGRMLLVINGKELTLNTGDSLYFNSALPHGMKALDGKTVKFLAMIF